MAFRPLPSIIDQKYLEKGSLAQALIAGDLQLAEALILLYRKPSFQIYLRQTFAHEDFPGYTNFHLTYAYIAAGLGYHELLQQLLQPLPTDNGHNSAQPSLPGEYFLEKDRLIAIFKAIFKYLPEQALRRENAPLSAREAIDYLTTLEVIFKSLHAIDQRQYFLSTLYQYCEPIENKSLLMLATEAGDPEVLSLFLQQFPPQLQAEFVNLKTEAGFTALHYACRKACTEIAEFLLDHGADFTAKDNIMGKTCLDELADQHPTKVQLLVKIARMGGLIGKTLPENWCEILKAEAEKPEHQGEFFLVGSTTLMNKGVQQFLGPRDIPGAVFTHSEASTTPLNIALTHLNQYKQQRALVKSAIAVETDHHLKPPSYRAKGKEKETDTSLGQDKTQEISCDLEPILAATKLRIRSVLKHTETALSNVIDDLDKGGQEARLLLQAKQEILYEFYLYFLNRDRDTRLKKILGYRFGHEQELQTYLKANLKTVRTCLTKEMYEALPLFTRSLIEAKPVLSEAFSTDEINKIKSDAQANIKALRDAIIDMNNRLAHVRFLAQVCTYDFKSSLFFLGILFTSLFSLAMATLFMLDITDVIFPCDPEQNSNEENSAGTTKIPICTNAKRAYLAAFSGLSIAVGCAILITASVCGGGKIITNLIPSNERKRLKQLSSDLNLLLQALHDENGNIVNLSSSKQAQLDQACQQLANALENLHETKSLEKAQASLSDIEGALNTILGFINTTANSHELFKINKHYAEARIKASRGVDLEQGTRVIWFNEASTRETETMPLLPES